MAVTLSRRATTVLASLAALSALALVVLGALPVGWLKDDFAQALSERTGRPVTIGSLEREDAFSFSPVIRVEDIAVPQAAWAGEGRLATIRVLRFRANVFALLTGRLRPKLLSASGVTLDLVRDAGRRVNWQKPGQDDDEAGSRGLSLTELTRMDAVVRYRDAFQKRTFQVKLLVDPRTGLTATGSGTIDGNPVTLSARGPAAAGGAWPFRLAITGDAIDMRVQGTMAAPLQIEKMTFKATARANDLKLVDRVIEAGLFGTQPVNLAADIRRDGGRWTIDRMQGTIGTSDVAGHASLVKADGATELDGAVHSRQLDFDDLASDAGNAAAVALERAEGVKVVPNTRIDIHKVAITRGRLTFQADRIVSRRRPSAIVAASGVLVIDGKLLTIKPLQLRLTKGTIGGQITVDQRGGRAKPIVTLALDLRGSSIGALAGGGGGKVDAPVDARVRLSGTGETIREAVGHADGTIGLVAHDGSLPAKLAALLGFDIGRTLFTGDNDRAALRCAVVRLAVRGGTGTAAPVVIDTSGSQANGTGTVSFPDERLALRFTGAPKGGSVLRLPGSMAVAGTIRDPEVLVSREVKSFSNILKGIGRAITGRQGPKATDADCAALSRQAVGG